MSRPIVVEFIGKDESATEVTEDVGRKVTKLGGIFKRTAKDSTVLDDGMRQTKVSLSSAADGSDELASRGSQAAGALSGLGDVVANQLGMPALGSAMMVGGTAAQAFADAGDLVNVALEATGIKAAAAKVASIAASAATKAWSGTQWALNAALNANPIGLVIVGVAALTAGLVIAYQKSDTFRAIVQGAFKGISSAATFMWDKVLKPVFKIWLNTWFTIVGAIVNGAASAFGWVPGIGDKLKAAADKFNQFRDNVNRSLDGINDKTVNVNVRMRGGTAANKFASDMGGPGGHADGTRFALGGRVLVGERGPEVVDLPRGSRVIPNGTARNMGAASGGISVTLTGPVYGDPRAFAQFIAQQLRALLREYPGALTPTTGHVTTR